MQYRKSNCLCNPPAQYSIYYMNHGKVVYIANQTTLDLGHRKFAVKYTPFHCCKLPLTSVLGRIFAIYTILPLQSSVRSNGLIQFCTFWNQQRFLSALLSHLCSLSSSQYKHGLLTCNTVTCFTMFNFSKIYLLAQVCLAPSGCNK